MSSTKKFQNAIDNFSNQHLQDYGACLNQVVNKYVCLEWRVNKKTGKANIIQFYENGKYSVYEDTNNQ